MSKLLNCSSRFMMMVMVIVFWCFSALLMFMGIKMLMLIGSLDAAIQNKFLSVPAIVLILLSLLCLIIGIIGCAGASFQSRKTQGVFFLLLFLILLLEVVGFFLCITYKEQLQEQLDETITSSVMEKYTGNITRSLTRSIDYIQETFECCGVNKSVDWLTSEWGKKHPQQVPGSCCKTPKCDTSKPVDYKPMDGHYDQGCEAKLVGRISGWLVWLIVLAVFFVLFEVLAMCCTCIRFKHSKKIRYQTLSEEQAAHGYRA